MDQQVFGHAQRDNNFIRSFSMVKMNPTHLFDIFMMRTKAIFFNYPESSNFIFERKVII